MKQFSLLVLFIGTLLVFTSESKSFAQGESEFTRELESQIGSIDEAISRSTDTGSVSEPQQEWYMKNFWLRLQMTAGLSVPGLLDLVITPETEMLFQRALPEGWSNYKPPRKRE